MASFTLEQVHEQLMDDDSSDLEETSAINHKDELRTLCTLEEHMKI